MPVRHSVDWLREQMADLGFRPSKGLGQSFLVAPPLAKKAAQSLDIQPKDRVLEIGPGFGVLTDELVALQEGGLEFELTLVEKDGRLADYLRKSYPGAKFIPGDALDVDMSGFDRLISNLPYSISTPMTIKLLELPFKKAVFMYQEEFAQRITALGGEGGYSRLGVKAQYQLHIQRLAGLPPSFFFPQPEIHSRLLAFTPRAEPPFPVLDRDFFYLLTDVLFAHRRKTIRNCLKAGRGRLAGYLKMDADELKKAFVDLPHLHQRVEELPGEELGKMADVLCSRNP